MLEPKELESIYNLLHSPVEDNVNLALAIIEGREDVKLVFDEALDKTLKKIVMYSKIHNNPIKDFVWSSGYEIIPLELLTSKNGWLSNKAFDDLCKYTENIIGRKPSKGKFKF